jgi:hypothetical protein
MKKITLTDWRSYTLQDRDKPDKPFVVKELTNTVSYKIGQSLSLAEVNRLCGDPNWTVKLISIN